MDNSLPKPTNPFDLPSTPQSSPQDDLSNPFLNATPTKSPFDDIQRPQDQPQTPPPAPSFDEPKQTKSDYGDDYNPFLASGHPATAPKLEITPDELPTQTVTTQTKTMPEPTPEPPVTARPAEIKPEPVVATPTPAPTPQQPKTELPKPSPTLTPATLSSAPKGPKSATPIIFAALGGGLLLTTAGTAFFWVQNQTLKHQLTTLQSIEAQRELNPTPTPTATVNNTTPTPTVQASFAAFTRIAAVITAAQQQSATAQLLMITSDNIGTPVDETPQTLTSSSTTYKYWFRTAPGTKTYFYVLADSSTDPKVISPASISPDNNIPDLIDSQKSNQLGLDADQAHSLIWTQLLTSYTQGNRPTAISAKYIKSIPSTPSISTPVNLWQLTYKFAAGSGIKDIVVQVDANLKTIIYSNIPSNITTPTPTTTTAATGS